MEVHFIDVGCGNMTLLILPDNSIYLYDCNITDENRERVLGYLKKTIGKGTNIQAFINSHRDADHMRGIRAVHAQNPIQQIWDNGEPGTTTNSPEYLAYMQLRRNTSIATKIIKPIKYQMLSDVKFRWMNSSWEDYTNPNEQSIVLKLEYAGSSVMLAGDTNFRPWKEKILKAYDDSSLESSILLAPHHGSIGFLDDPSDESNYYTSHIQKIKPAMTIISVGPNPHDLPDKKALELYEKYSRGSDKGNKVYTTKDKGTMKLTLKTHAKWGLSIRQ